MAQQGLTILMDRARTGKSAALWREIAAEGLKGRQMLLVPEHASHQAERDLCRACGNRASRHAAVASFRWLAADVLEYAGGAGDTMLDGGGKILTMYRALQKNLSVLKLYRRPSQRAAFLEQLIHLDDELRSYQVSAEDLLARRGAVSGPLADKLQDLALICGSYEALLTENGRDCRDLMDRLLDALKTEKGQDYFRGMRIYADGFLYFNAREEEVLRCMIRCAESVTVTLLGDRERTGGIYDVAQKVRGRLVRIAAEEGRPCRTIASPLRGEKQGDAALRHLEQAFFGKPFACARRRTPMPRWNMRRHRSARCFALDSAAAGIFWCAPAICPIMRLPLKMCLNAMRSRCF